MRLLIATVVPLLIAPVAFAATISFDDLGAQASSFPVPDGYAGLNWDTFHVVNPLANGLPLDSGYVNGVVSGDSIVFNAGAAQASVSSGTFTFNSVSLTAAWNDGLSILVQGLFNGIEQYSDVVTVGIAGPSIFEFNWLGINELRFTSFGGIDVHPTGSGTHFAMDDLTINETASPIPEPTAALIFGIGALLVGRVDARMPRRRRHVA